MLTIRLYLFVIMLWYSKWFRSTLDLGFRGFCLKSNPLVSLLAEGGPLEVDLQGLVGLGLPMGPALHDLPDALVVVASDDVVLMRTP